MPDNNKKLSDEDMARVAQYLNSPGNRDERAPFRPWLLLGFLTVVVTILSALSMWYAWMHGVRIL
jgi:hypothetical protein